MPRLAAFALLLAPALLAAPPAAPEARLAELERRSGGRLGVSVLDTRSGRRIAYRGGERFLLCSTFKVVLAGAVLARVEAGKARLDQRLSFGEADLLGHAPVCRARVKEGSLPLGELCAAILQVSDNTAANLLLRFLGGPEVLTAYLRTLGDSVSRLDRWEPELNRPGGERDTTTPEALCATLRELLSGRALSSSGQRQLAAWMSGSTTGRDRLRAGFPADWSVLNKTGTGPDGNPTNDIAQVTPPGGAPIYIAAYLANGKGEARDQEAILAEAARIITGACSKEPGSLRRPTSGAGGPGGKDPGSPEVPKGFSKL